jgi:hypothetical protein
VEDRSTFNNFKMSQLGEQSVELTPTISNQVLKDFGAGIMAN